MSEQQLEFKYEWVEEGDIDLESLTLADIDLEDFPAMRFNGSELAQIRYFKERGCMPKSREELEANDY